MWDVPLLAANHKRAHLPSAALHYSGGKSKPTNRCCTPPTVVVASADPPAAVPLLSVPTLQQKAKHQQSYVPGSLDIVTQIRSSTNAPRKCADEDTLSPPPWAMFLGPWIALLF